MRALGLLVALVAVLTVTAPPAGALDPDWVFYTSDKHHYTSPWYAGAHRIMVPFGCTTAPYYDHDPRCPGEQGFHHGAAERDHDPVRSGVPRRGVVVLVAAVEDPVRVHGTGGRRRHSEQGCERDEEPEHAHGSMLTQTLPNDARA